MPTASSATSLEHRVNAALALVLGALLGISAVFQAFYGSSVWGPLSLGALALCLALIAGARGAVPRLGLLAIGGLVGLWLWSLVSRGWSESPAAALVDANRWALYAAILTTLILIVRADRRAARLLLGAATAGVLVVGLYVLARLLFGDGRSLFLGGRLNRPLGYINGEACYLLLGFWPLVGLAEDWRRPLRAVPALAGATLLASLAFVSQSRGSLLAFVVSAIAVVLALPGRRARILAVLVVAAAVYLASDALAAVYRHPDPHTGIAVVSQLHRAGRGALLASLGVALAWAVVCVSGRVLGGRQVRGRGGAGLAATAVLIAVTVVAVGIVAVRAGSIRHTISHQYNAFVHLDTSSGDSQTRLFSGAGNRYDYWRIAWSEFKAEPLRGVGAGGYDVGYYRQRRTTEEITQPHSIELQTLAELGVIGALALLMFLVAACAGVFARGRLARKDRGERILAVAAGGMFFVWLGQTSVDWMHYLPGVTGIALCAVAVLVSPAEAAEPRPLRVPAWVPRALGVVVIGVAALLTARMTLAEHDQAQAQAQLVHDPVGALARSNDALSLESDVVGTYYVRAAALARLGLYQDARASLLRGVRLEPHNWVTWALLGDLAVRHGDFRVAGGYYARALALNPLERSIGDLQVPAGAKQGAAR